MRSSIIFLALTACGLSTHDVGETLTDSGTSPSDSSGSSETSEPTATTGTEVCEAPQWFQCGGTDICDVQPCQAGVGLLDENGCEQIACSENADCAEGQRCFDTVIAGFQCESSGTFCTIEDGTCGCGVNDDCRAAARCVPESVATDQECPTDGLDCEGLLGFMDILTETYHQRLAEQSFELAMSIGSCAQTVEGEVLAEPDLCDRSLCEEVCRLHPCESPEGDCVTACETSAVELDDAQLREIALAAAASPVLCTCDVCTPDSFDFCATVWGCQAG